VQIEFFKKSKKNMKRSFCELVKKNAASSKNPKKEEDELTVT